MGSVYWQARGERVMVEDARWKHWRGEVDTGDGIKAFFYSVAHILRSGYVQ